MNHSEDCERCDGLRWVTTWTDEDGQDDYLCWCIEATETSELCVDCRKVNPTVILFQGGPMDGEDSARYQDEDGTTYHTISLTTDFEWGNYVLTDTGTCYVWHPRGGCPMPPRQVPDA